ncbi:hypothetical protein YC2023_110858 [Brassica napus]
MSANKRFHLISDLKPFKEVWHVQIKLIHSWIQNPHYADETLEIVLADQTSSKQQPDQNKTVLPIGIYEAQNLYARNRNIDHDLIDVYSHNERLKAERRIVA